MTLSITASATVYTANGSQTRFYVKNGSDGIYFESAADLTVTLRSGDTITSQSVGTHYTVTGALSDTGYIDFITAPANGVEVRIERNTPMTQGINLSVAGAFNPETVEGGFDKLTRIVQDLARGGSGGEGRTGTHDSDSMTKLAGGNQWDAANLPIRNLVNGTEDDDAVTKAQLDAAVLGTTSFTQSGTGAIERTWLTKLRETSRSVLDYIPVAEHAAIMARTSTTDVSSYIQAAINAHANVYVPPGTYIAKGLTLSSDKRLFGDGGTVSILKAPSGLGATEKILSNATFFSYTDSNISIYGIGFDGNNAGSGGSQTRNTGLVEFDRVTNLLVESCDFSNSQYIHVTNGGCRRAVFSNNRFRTWGYQGTTANAGPALWISNSLTAAYQSEDVTVINNRFEEGYWHGITIHGYRCKVIGNTFYKCREAGIFAPHDDSTILNVDMVISGNVIYDVRENDISGSGIEFGGHGITIADNVFDYCDHNGISGTNVQDVTISGNVVRNCNQDRGSSTPGGVGIVLIENPSVAPDVLRNVTVTGNTVIDDQVSGTMPAAFKIGILGAAGAQKINVTGNTFHTATAWSAGAAVSINTPSLVTDSAIVNNIGYSANTIHGTTFSPAADGGCSLGTTALGWQNLFGNTGFVFNIENGNWVATHTSGILTVGTGDVRVTTAGTNTASVVTVGGTQTLTNKTLTSPTLTTPALGTPASGTLTNCTGLPISSGVSGLATGVATFLGTPTVSNLSAALTDEGSGMASFLGKTVTAWTTWSPTITPGSGSFTTITISSARYIRVNDCCYFSILFQIAAVGTGSGAINIPLPLTAAGPGAVYGNNVSSSQSIAGAFFSGATSVDVRLYSNASAIVDTNYYVVNGFYQV